MLANRPVDGLKSPQTNYTPVRRHWALLPHRQSWKLTSVCVCAEPAAKGTAHWFHLREAVVWAQVMRLRAGRRTLGMAYNCIVTLCNESLIFSAPGWRLTSSITRSPSQRDALGKVRSPRDSLSPPVWKNEKTNNRTWLGVIADGIVVFADSLLLERDIVRLSDEMRFTGWCPYAIMWLPWHTSRSSISNQRFFFHALTSICVLAYFPPWLYVL